MARKTVPPAKQPSREQLENFTRDLSDEYLYCRRFGHGWHPRTAIKKKWWFEATVSCDRCGCERIEVINLRGEIVKRLMYYPKGYLAVNMGRIVGESKNYLRLAALERGTIEDRSEEDDGGEPT